MKNCWIGLVFSALVYSCASISVFDDGHLSNQTGFKVYSPTLYVLVEKLDGVETNTTTFYGPDPSSEQFVKMKSGFGFKNVALSIENGMVTSIGKAPSDRKEVNVEKVIEEPTDSDTEVILTEVEGDEKSDDSIEKMSGEKKIKKTISKELDNSSHLKKIVELYQLADEYLVRLQYSTLLSEEQQGICRSLSGMLNERMEGLLNDGHVQQASPFLKTTATTIKINQLLLEENSAEAKSHNNAVLKVKEWYMQGTLLLPKYQEANDGLKPGLYMISLDANGESYLKPLYN